MTIVECPNLLGLTTVRLEVIIPGLAEVAIVCTGRERIAKIHGRTDAPLRTCALMGRQASTTIASNAMASP